MMQHTASTSLVTAAAMLSAGGRPCSNNDEVLSRRPHLCGMSVQRLHILPSQIHMGMEDDSNLLISSRP